MYRRKQEGHTHTQCDTEIKNNAGAKLSVLPYNPSNMVLCLLLTVYLNSDKKCRLDPE